MTDPHDLDDIASAHLDGATSAEEAARVAADPALQARVEELRAVRDALAEVPPVAPEAREAAVAAALAAFDEGDAPEQPAAPVTPLAPRRGLSPAAARALSVAAVVLLIALLVPLLASIDSDDETASFDSTGDAIEGGAESASDGGEDAARDAAPSTVGAPQQSEGGQGVAPAPVVDLGTFQDLDALAAAVAADETGPPANGVAAFDSSDEALCTQEPGAVLLAVAIVGAAPVLVYVYGADEGSPTLVVFRRESCELLGEHEL